MPHLPDSGKPFRNMLWRGKGVAQVCGKTGLMVAVSGRKVMQFGVEAEEVQAETVDGWVPHWPSMRAAGQGLLT